MLCTNWGDMDLFEDTTTFFVNSDYAFWLKAVVMWITMAVYLYALIAPLYNPDRF